MESLIRTGDKKPYRKPLLAVYGSVQQLTQNLLSSTTGDNTQHTNNKRRNTRVESGAAPKKTR